MRLSRNPPATGTSLDECGAYVRVLTPIAPLYDTVYTGSPTLIGPGSSTWAYTPAHGSGDQSASGGMRWCCASVRRTAGSRGSLPCSSVGTAHRGVLQITRTRRLS